MRILAMAALGAAIMLPARAADMCPSPGQTTLSGKVSSIQSMREEPEASVETWFKIALKEPICGKTEVTGSVIGIIPCVDGDAITVTGEFSPPSQLTGMARIRSDQTQIRCDPE